jgi:hypothetical protein
LFASALCSLPIDLFRPLGYIGENHYLVWTDLQKAARDSEVMVLAIGPIHQLASDKRRYQRLVPVQDSNISVSTTRNHDLRVLFQNHALGCDHF